MIAEIDFKECYESDDQINHSDCSDPSYGNWQSLKDHATNFFNILLDR